MWYKLSWKAPKFHKYACSHASFYLNRGKNFASFHWLRGKSFTSFHWLRGFLAIFKICSPVGKTITKTTTLATRLTSNTLLGNAPTSSIVIRIGNNSWVQRVDIPKKKKKPHGFLSFRISQDVSITKDVNAFLRWSLVCVTDDHHSLAKSLQIGLILQRYVLKAKPISHRRWIENRQQNMRCTAGSGTVLHNFNSQQFGKPWRWRRSAVQILFWKISHAKKKKEFWGRPTVPNCWF